MLESKTPAFLTPRCGQCGLLNGCKSPKMPVAGAGKRNILVIGEAPGETEDNNNRPFIGKAGQRLQRVARSVGMDLFEDCRVTNALICRPPGNKIPKDVMVDYCRPNVTRAIETYRPHTIIVLGAYAVRSVIGGVWREDPGGIARWAGFRIPLQRYNAWVCPTWHPSYLERMQQPDPVAENEFRDHLAAAFKTAAARPWKTTPDYKSEIRLVYNPDEAARLIARFGVAEAPVAFDFETDRLKPHHPSARVVCCSISDGIHTIAYPMAGAAIQATRALLTNPRVPKIGANIKFEQEWCMARLGYRVAGWLWDVVIGAHGLDARPGITSVKFQAFARFGVDDYDHHVHQFLEAREKGGNSRNEIHRVDLRNLLVYCGMDSLLEFKVAVQQRREYGYG